MRHTWVYNGLQRRVRRHGHMAQVGRQAGIGTYLVGSGSGHLASGRDGSDAACTRGSCARTCRTPSRATVLALAWQVPLAMPASTRGPPAVDDPAHPLIRGAPSTHAWPVVPSLHPLLQVARYALTAQELQALAAAQQEQALSAAEASSSSSGSCPLPAALVSELKGIAVGAGSSGGGARAAANGGGGAASPKRPLIVDLTQQQQEQQSAPAAAHSTVVEVTADAAGQRWVRVQVCGLPGVQRAQDVDVEMVGGREVVVTPLMIGAGAPGAADAVRVALPLEVDRQRITAKFEPKAKVLTLTLAEAGSS